MVTTIGCLLLLAGVVIVARPAETGAALRRLGRLGRAPDYWYSDPDRIRNSRGLRAAYRLNGVFLVLTGLYLIGALPVTALYGGDVREAVARLFGLLAPAYFVWVGARFVIDPAWFEAKWAAKPPDPADRLYRFRLKGYRVMGAVFIALALYMWWPLVRTTSAP